MHNKHNHASGNINNLFSYRLMISVYILSMVCVYMENSWYCMHARLCQAMYICQYVVCMPCMQAMHVCTLAFHVFCWYVYGKQAVMVNNPTGSAIEFITLCIFHIHIPTTHKTASYITTHAVVTLISIWQFCNDDFSACISGCNN